MGIAINQKYKKRISVGFFAVLSLLLIAVCAKRLFLAGDIDQWTAISEAYRIALGEIPFDTLWAPQSLSYFGLAFIEKIWLTISGSCSGMVLWCRVVSLMIQLAIAVYLYQTIRRYISSGWAFCITSIFLLYLTKKYLLLEYGNITVWLSIACSCLYLDFQDKKKNLYLVLFGICFFFLVITFPSFALLLLIYVPLFLSTQENREGKTKVFLTVLIPFLVLGVCLLFYLTKKGGIEGLFNGILNTYSGSGYSLSFLQTFGYIVWYPLIGEIKECLPILIVSVLVAGLMGKAKFFDHFFATVLILDFVNELYYCISEHYEWHLRFIPILVIIGLFYSIKNKDYIWLALISTGVLGLVATLLMSSINITDAYREMFPGMLFSLIYLERINHPEKKLIFLSTLGFMLFCALCFMRPSGGYALLWDHDYTLVESGPMKGIYLQNCEYGLYEEISQLSEEEIEEDEQVAYFGSDNLLYLMKNISCAMPTQVINSWIGSSGEGFLHYYDVFPEKKPTTIVVEKEVAFVPNTTSINAAYMLNGDIWNWIKQNYKLDSEDSSFLVYRKD